MLDGPPPLLTGARATARDDHLVPGPHCRPGVRHSHSGRRRITTTSGRWRGVWAERLMAMLILHLNREVIHHGAEITCYATSIAPVCPVHDRNG